jgi:hypothetical protein
MIYVRPGKVIKYNVIYVQYCTQPLYKILQRSFAVDDYLNYKADYSIPHLFYKAQKFYSIFKGAVLHRAENTSLIYSMRN